MDNMEIMDRDINAPFMFPVSEKYNEMGTMVMGKIESGRVKKGDSLLCMPNKVGPGLEWIRMDFPKHKC
jgi:peptide chain release factor subunit 3